MQLEFIYKRVELGYMSQRWVPYRCSREKVLGELLVAAKTRTETQNLHGVISTLCGNEPRKLTRLFLKPKPLHLYGGDCDSLESAAAAVQHLVARHTHAIAIVESSPHRFWVFADLVKPLEEMVELVRGTPGTDITHIETAAKLKALTFRAFPKRIGFPRLLYNSMYSRHATNWLDSFLGYFASPEFAAVIKQMRLAETLKKPWDHSDPTETPTRLLLEADVPLTDDDIARVSILAR